MPSELIPDAAPAALELIAKTVIVIALVAAFAAALRKAPATTRHALWLTAVALLVVMPLAAAALPELSIPVLPAPPTPAVTPAPVESPIVIATPTVAGHVDPTVATAAVAPGAPANAPAAATWSLDTWLLLVWSIGLGLIALRALIGVVGVARLGRHADPVTDAAWSAALDAIRREMGIARPVALVRSDRAAVPMTWGVVRPTVCLPADSHDWPETKRRIVLSHELAHVRRGDWLWQLVATVATALHWFNPLAWWAARRLRTEAETACDDTVITHGCRPTDYADCLYELVRDSRAARPAFTLAVAMARRSELPERLAMILDESIRRRPMRLRTLAAVLCGALLAGALVAVAQLDHARADPTPKPGAPLAIEKDNNPLITDAHRAAIDRGVAYLIANQHADGGIGEAHGKPATMRTGTTALVLLALLAHDGPDADERIKKAIDAAIRFLSATQNAAGQLGAREQNESMYSHGLALLALVKAYERTRDNDLKPIINRAIQLNVQSQNATGGWRYRPNSNDADTPIVSAQLVALAAAAASGFTVPHGTFEAATAYLVSCQNADGGFRYRKDRGRSGAARSAAAVAALIASRADDEPVATGAGYVVLTLEEGVRAHRLYAEYYRSLVFGAMDAKRFNDWYKPNAAALLKSQAPDGSWIGEISPEVSTPMALIVLQSPNKKLQLARRAHAAAQAQPEDNAPPANPLDTAVGFDLNNLDVSDALDLLAETADLAEMNVEWEALAEVGIQPETPVSIRFKNLRASVALRLILEQAAGRPHAAGFIVNDDTVHVTTVRANPRSAIRTDHLPASPVNKRTHARLAAPADVRVRMENFTLHDIIGHLQQLHAPDVNFFVSDHQLRVAGIKPDTKFIVNADADSARAALDQVLQQVNKTARVPLGYRIEDGVVTLRTVRQFATVSP